jgi:hypothetical protein
MRKLKVHLVEDDEKAFKPQTADFKVYWCDQVDVVHSKYWPHFKREARPGPEFPDLVVTDINLTEPEGADSVVEGVMITLYDGLRAEIMI